MPPRIPLRFGPSPLLPAPVSALRRLLRVERAHPSIAPASSSAHGRMAARHVYPTNATRAFDLFDIDSINRALVPFLPRAMRKESVSRRHCDASVPAATVLGRGETRNRTAAKPHAQRRFAPAVGRDPGRRAGVRSGESVELLRNIKKRANFTKGKQSENAVRRPRFEPENCLRKLREITYFLSASAVSLRTNLRSGPQGSDVATGLLGGRLRARRAG